MRKHSSPSKYSGREAEGGATVFQSDGMLHRTVFRTTSVKEEWVILSVRSLQNAVS